MSNLRAAAARATKGSPRVRVLFGVLAVVFLIGLVYRLGYLLPGARVYGDGYWRYDPIARNLLAGHGFSYERAAPYTPDIFDVPGYPLFVTAIYALFGASPHAVALAQFLLELLTLGLVYRIGKWAGLSQRSALIGAVLGWLLPNLASWCRETYADVLASFAVSVLLGLLIRAWCKPKSVPLAMGMLLGAVAGVCAQIRVDIYPIVVFSGLALAAKPAHGGLSKRFLLLATYGLGSVLVLLPWTLRDYRLTGAVHPPGWQQFTQASDPYLRWCNTWVDDPDYVLPYMLHRAQPDSIRTFPPDRIPDAIERSQAEAAYAKWIAAGTGGEPEAEFRRLAEIAERRLTLKDQVRMRVRRLAMVWLKLPSMADLPGGKVSKIAKYAIWVVLLFGFCAALVFGVVRRQWWLVLPLGVIAGRMLIPLVSALGTEIRYQYPALPALFIMAGYGLDQCLTAFLARRRLAGDEPLTTENSFVRTA